MNSTCPCGCSYTQCRRLDAVAGAPAGGQQPSPQPALKHPRLQADSSPPTPSESAISPLPPSVPAPGPLLPPPTSQAPYRSHEVSPSVKAAGKDLTRCLPGKA